MRLRSIAVVAVLIGTLTSGCQRDTPQPAPLPSGQAACAECQSVIHEPRFAAQYQVGDEAPRFFDDPGCLIRALRREASPPKAVYFRDHDSERWLPAAEVWFARTPQSKSPHGYGWAAFADFAAAQNAVTSAGGGEILQYDEARQRIATE